MKPLDVTRRFESNAYKFKDGSFGHLLVTKTQRSLDELVASRGVALSFSETFVSDFARVYDAFFSGLDARFNLSATRSGTRSAHLFSLERASRAIARTLPETGYGSLNGSALAGLGKASTPDTFLEASLSSLQSAVTGYDAGSISKSLFSYFALVDRSARAERERMDSSLNEELDALETRLVLDGKQADFSAFPQKVKTKKAQRASTDNASANEELPSDVPAYIFSHPTASISDVIGNQGIITELQTAVHQLFDYDFVRGENAWGTGWSDAHFIFGMEGVGKTFTVDAVLNYARGVADELGKPLRINEINRDLRSSYVNRMAALVNHFSMQMRESQAYNIVVFEEADGMFTPSDRHGAEQNKLIQDFKGIIEKTGKANILWLMLSNNLQLVERAVKDRLSKHYMQAPSTSDEIADLFRLQFRRSINEGKFEVSNDQLYSIGERYRGMNASLQGIGATPLTGRDVKRIADGFVVPDKGRYLRVAKDINRLSFDEKRSAHRRLLEPVTKDAILDRLDDVYTSRAREVQTQREYAGGVA